MSIQQSINSQIYRMADQAITPEQIKSIQAHLVKGVQSGSVPSYVGIPLLNDLNQKMARIQMAPAQAQAMTQQPPIAQQVMSQAEQSGGVPSLPSGLPAEGMAGGGIVAFARGGDLGLEADLIDEDEDLDFMDEMSKSMGRMQDMYSRMAEMEDSGISALAPVESKTFVTETPEGAAIERVAKRTGDGAVQIEHDKKAVQGDDLLQKVLARESGGRRYDKSGRLLTSPKGAEGEMQVMPATQRDPGFGVEPARGRDPEEIARVGRDYLRALRNRYGNDKLAMIAYNWGPGNTDKWLMSGADPSKLPAETRQYVAGMAAGGAVRYQTGGITDIFSMTPEEIKDAIRRKIRMEQARAAFTPSQEAVTKSPSWWKQLLGPAGVVGAGGAAATGVAGGILGGASEEGLGQLSADIGSDTGWAAAIMQQARQKEGPPAITPPPKRAPAKQTMATLPTSGGPGSPEWGMDLGKEEVPGGIATLDPNISANLDQEDIDRASAMQQLQQGRGEVAAEAKPQGVDYLKKLRDRIEKGYTNLEEQKKTDAYMALLSAGLGMMGGTSPFAAANIGAGGLKGVQSWQQSEAARAAQEKALMSAELGAERYAQYGELTKAQQKAMEEFRKAELERKKEATATAASTALQRSEESSRMRAATIIQRMEQQYDAQALADAKLQIDKSLIPLDESQKAEIIANVRALYRNKLNQNKRFRLLNKQAFEGYDPGELDLPSDIGDAVARILKTKK